MAATVWVIWLCAGVRYCTDQKERGLWGREWPDLGLVFECVTCFCFFIQIGSNLYMDTGVRDLEAAFFKANSA